MTGLLQLQLLEECALDCLIGGSSSISHNIERFLEEASGNNTDGDGGIAQLNGNNDSQVLRDTLRIYGTFFVVVLLMFCFLRRMYPRVYNLRNWVEDLQTEIAAKQQGFFSWMWRTWGITDTEMLDECGVDALCYLRVLEFGCKLALIGTVNAAWLIPVYWTAEEAHSTDYITDSVVAMSVSNVPAGSYRFIATVVGSYIIFGFAMFALLQEFQWFTMYRHQFLSKKLPRNYAVYVQCIPDVYQTNRLLFDFFSEASAKGTVLEANVALRTPQLSRKVRERESILRKLEHAINVEDLQQPKTTHFSILAGEESIGPRSTRTVASQTRQDGGIVRHLTPFRKQASLVDTLFEELRNSNADITQLIERIQLKAADRRFGMDEEFGRRWEPDEEQTKFEDEEEANIIACLPSLVQTYTGSGDEMSTLAEEPSRVPQEDPSVRLSTTSKNSNNRTNSSVSKQNPIVTITSSAAIQATRAANHAMEKAALVAANTAKTTVVVAANTAKTTAALTAHAATAATQTAAQATQQAIKLLLQEDGDPLSAGFVTFKTLRSTQAALQMVQCSEPFAMQVLEAPQPQDIVWSNVGKTHYELQVGKLLSFAATAALCLFWTVPMSFISSLSTIEGLRAVPFINTMLDAAPWLVPVFAQLAPLLIVAANQALKMILEYFSGLEGPISGAVLSASLFSKLGAFMLIQTFFVTAISGSLAASYTKILEDPSYIIELLATTLPAQSTFFIQILLVDTFVAMSVELLRVPSVVLAVIRNFVGPNLTEKERQTTWNGIRPLSDPFDFEHADVLASTVLYFMVYFVYAPIAPITTFFMLICFLLLSIGYRHQFIYIYPTFPDSGGKLWIAFVDFIPTCMIIAQVTICGMLSLKQQPVAVSMMIPLIIITFLFTFYIHQEHFKVTQHLPSRECIKTDLKNNAEREMDYEFLHEQYVQPELRNKELYPENATVERQIEHGCVSFATPTNSVNGDE